MPTASPIINASEGVEVFTSANAATASTPIMATATPRMAVTIGIPAASSEPNVIARTSSATSTPMASVALTWTCVLVSAWPPRCTSSLGVAGQLGRLLEIVDGAGLDLVERDVELHLGEGVAPVVADREPALLLRERVGHDLDVVDLLHLGEHGVHLAVVRRDPLAVRGDEEDLSGRAGQLGEALLERVETLLRLGPGDGHVVLQLATETHGQRAESDQQRCPEGEHRLGPAGDGVAEAIEVGGHLDTVTYSIRERTETWW